MKQFFLVLISAISVLLICQNAYALFMPVETSGFVHAEVGNTVKEFDHTGLGSWDASVYISEAEWRFADAKLKADVYSSPNSLNVDLYGYAEASEDFEPIKAYSKVSYDVYFESSGRFNYEYNGSSLSECCFGISSIMLFGPYGKVFEHNDWFDEYSGTLSGGEYHLSFWVLADPDGPLEYVNPFGKLALKAYSVSEPSTIVLMGLGIIGLARFRRKFQN